jgi:alpha-ketoglutarate-dependent 2,4-dichlorophenoxyacetate dioxygenase
MAQYAVCVTAMPASATQITSAQPRLRPRAAAGRRTHRARAYDISNSRQGEIALIPRQGSPRLRAFIHSPFNTLPTKWSFLLAHVGPPQGADTIVVDTRAAYDDLPQATKERIENLVAEHDMFRALERTGVKFGDEAMRRMFPMLPHPLVRTSANGRKTLYLGWHAVGIVGWPEPEAQKLLDELVAFATSEKYLYVHKWRQADMLIWDNRCTMHSATSFERYRYKRDCAHQ